jgi:hypothetical protein
LLLRKENVIKESLSPERQTRLYIVMLLIVVPPPLHSTMAFVSLMWKGARTGQVHGVDVESPRVGVKTEQI